MNLHYVSNAAKFSGPNTRDHTVQLWKVTPSSTHCHQLSLPQYLLELLHQFPISFDHCKILLQLRQCLAAAPLCT